MQNITRKRKIHVVLSADKDKRDALLHKMLCRAGFALIDSDAKKIVKAKISDIDIDGCFFVSTYDFNFIRNHLISQKLVAMAIQGIPVFISTKSIPNVYLQFCEIIEEL